MRDLGGYKHAYVLGAIVWSAFTELDYIKSMIPGEVSMVTDPINIIIITIMHKRYIHWYSKMSEWEGLVNLSSCN